MLLPRFRPIRLLVILALLLLAWTVPSVYEHKNKFHVLQPDLYRWQNIGPPKHLLLPEKISEFCNAHGFKEYFRKIEGGLDLGRRERKVYDLFLLATELDWLEIRLHTLSPYVDHFVIVESRTTFTGLPKPASLAENWEKFAPFHGKIIHRVVEDPGDAVGPRTWDHEDFMRNALFDKVFPELIGTSQEPQEGDVLIVSDMDEIPKPETLVVLKKCQFPDRLTLRSDFYYYSFQWQHRGEQWPHPQATNYHGLEGTILPKDLRNGEPGSPGWFFINHFWNWWERADMWDAAWHCSSCFSTIKQMQSKMESFSHVGLNSEGNRDPATMLDRVRNGKDLFGRPGEIYDKVDGNRDVPNYILQHKGAFGYMLDRDGEDAAFLDWVSES